MNLNSMTKRLVIVGGLAAFSAFGLWLGHRGDPTRVTRYTGHVQYVCPEVDRCVRVGRVRVNKVYQWQCVEMGSYPATGNLSFAGENGSQHHLFNLPGDTLDLWGVVQTADTYEARRVDIEEVVVP